MRRIILLLLCGVGLWSCSGTTRYLGPTAQGYMFHASAFPDELFLPSDLVSPEEFPTSATVLVQVRDRNQAPVEGVPVTFQYAGSECRGVLTLSAQQAVTRMISASDIKNRRVPCPKSRASKRTCIDAHGESVSNYSSQVFPGKTRDSLAQDRTTVA